MALPPGPLGLATVIPDLLAIWKLQQQLVADIAAVFGKGVVVGVPQSATTRSSIWTPALDTRI
jgi:hypothetical protein